MTAPTKDDGTTPSQAQTKPGALLLSDALHRLSLFTQGIGGHQIALAPSETHAYHRRGHRAQDSDQQAVAASDGKTLWLPPCIDYFAQTSDNFRVYRVAVLHHLGYREFGTFQFKLSTARQRLDDLPDEKPRTTLATPLDLEKFFALFDAEFVMRAVFTSVESWRIDQHIARRYPGARRDLERVMAAALSARPAPDTLAPLPAMLERLLQATLSLQEPTRMQSTVQRNALAISRMDLCALLLALKPSAAPGASVYDSAAASLRIYRLLTDAGLLDQIAVQAINRAHAQAPLQADKLIADDKIAATIPVMFRGEPFAPPALARRRHGIGDLADTNAANSADTSLTPNAEEDLVSETSVAPGPPVNRPEPQVRRVLIDEWDYLNQVYKKAWCQLIEYRLQGAPGSFQRDLLNRHREQFAHIKRQFNAIRPQATRQQHRMVDGDDFDLDQLIERAADRRAGHSGDERVYQRRERAQRDVAAAFLLDMSASTDFPVPGPDPETSADQSTERSAANQAEPEDEGWALYGFVRDRVDAPPAALPSRRVIDVARDSLGLMCAALETLGDRFAIFGFSGQGREKVTFGVAKSFDENCSPRTWGALAAISPQGSTRMGAAVRHSISHLSKVSARLKVLIIVSDGYPQDLDYGPDRNSDEYGLQDTAMALKQAQQRAIQTFCITVDPAGNDYLRRMCPDGRYLVIDEVNALPAELSKVYQTLTA